MRTIYEHPIGDAIEGLYIDGEFIIQQTKYPLVKALEPADKFIDSSIDTAEAKIPGDWDKMVLEPLRALAHAELKKLAGG
jgi:hypothetical protein